VLSGRVGATRTRPKESAFVIAGLGPTPHYGHVDWYVDAEVPGAMTRLRHEVVAYLRRHASNPDSLDEAELVVSEVVGNAVRHAGGPVWVSLTWREVYPRLVVRDLGPGFDPEVLAGSADPLDGLGDLDSLDEADLEALEQLGEGGRGFFLIGELAEDLAIRTRDNGTEVAVVLPAKRAATLDHDPPRSTVNPLPALAEARPEGAFGKDSFLRALVVQLARTVDFHHGPDAAEAVVAQVGTDVGGQMEEEFRLAEQVVGAMSPEQMGQCYVRLKHAIDGGFSVVEADEHRIVLANTRCPFGDVVKLAPALCRMTSSVFGGIAARNSGHRVAVLLEERIAVGDPGCRVVVALDDSTEIDTASAHLYAPPSP
jgi:anti-sigma regulatory factor (Ser/Thr protein kinase)